MGKYDMKAYVINLESRPDRMVEFAKNSLPFQVERFNAIKTDPGWVGCTNSQLAILKQQKEFPFIIFEDDCLMLQSWSVVENSMKQLPPNWDALYLGATLMQPIERYSENLFRIKGAFCAHAIIYNTWRMVRYVLDNHEEFFRNSVARNTLDVFYAHDVQNKFNCYITDPLVATQRSGFSNIENIDVDYIQIIEHFNIYTNAGQ